MDLTASERGAVTLLDFGYQASHAQNSRNMDDIVSPWMKHCNEFHNISVLG